MVETVVIDWDGTNTPRELSQLLPGRYVVVPLDPEEMTLEEDAAVQEGLNEVDAGQIVPLDEVIREFESRFRSR